MEFGINGKKALVTGGAQGIGQAISQEFAKEGVKVAFTTRNQAALDETIEMLGGNEAGHYGIMSPLAEEGAPALLAEDVKKNFGDVDILVNNVGHTLNVTDPYCSIDDWRKVMRLNFEIAVEMNNLFLPYMKKTGWGRIVNITSCAGLENSGPVTFSASKAALTAYTRSMGRILAMETPNVVMTAVFPGVVMTKGGHWEKVLKENPAHAEKYLQDRSPLGRFGEIEEISPMVVFMCSEQASFCQGSIVPVDAGQSKHYMSFNYME
jgi:NAD(P)-dependent dehydrogenase (short-subunit alcohol dehydrogenase family)